MNEQIKPLQGGIKLNPRLRKIAELVPQGCTAADIGTDHAYIPAYLALNGKIKHAVASDIRPGPLSRAENTIKTHHLEAYIETRIGAGLETVLPGEAEVIIIAGMGGILISEILENSPEVVRAAKLIILQPMTAVLELRRYISENSFTLCGEYLVREDAKLYNIITVSPGGKTDYNLRELYLGKDLDKTSVPLDELYERRIIGKLQKQAEGLKKSSDEKNISKYNEIIKIINNLK